MKKVLFLCCLLTGLTALPLHAQFFAGGRDQVIAPSGLILRATPSVEGERLTAVPYLERVELLADRSFGYDTLGMVPHYHRYGVPDGVVDSNPLIIDGHWVKARYNGRVGYLFDAYLANPAHLMNDNNEQAFVVLTPGANCGDRLFDPKQFYEYGVYGEGTATRIVPVRGSYVYKLMEIGGHAPHYYVDRMEGLRYVIASKQPLDPAQMTFEAAAADLVHASDTAAHRAYAARAGVRIGDTLLTDNDYQHHLRVVDLVRDGQRQQLRTEWVYDVRLLGHGDLDGDGLPDYLIDVSREMLSERRLYLSGRAGPGKVARRVATERFGPCC